MYEKLLQNSREDIIQRYEKEKNQIAIEHKLQLFEQTKKHNSEIEKLTMSIENKYKEIITNLKAKFDKEKFDLFTDNLKKMESVQEMCSRKIKHLEMQLSAVRQNLNNDIDMLNEKIKIKDKEINQFESGLKEKINELNKANDLVLKITEEKNKITEEYKKLIDGKDLS